MARTIVLDGLDVTQVVLMKDKATGKILVRATYQVKAGNETVKTLPDRSLTFSALVGRLQEQADVMTSQEQTSASAAWDVVVSALRRLEL